MFSLALLMALVSQPAAAVPPPQSFCQQAPERCVDLTRAESRHFSGLLEELASVVPTLEGHTRHLSTAGPAERGVGVRGAAFPMDTWVGASFVPETGGPDLELQLTPVPMACPYSGPSVAQGTVKAETPDLLVVEWKDTRHQGMIALMMVVGPRQAVERGVLVRRSGTEPVLARLPEGPASEVESVHVFIEGPTARVHELADGIDTAALLELARKW